MADEIFDTEVTQFALRTKNECLEEILALWGEDKVDRVVDSMLEDINKQLKSNLIKTTKI